MDNFEMLSQYSEIIVDVLMPNGCESLLIQFILAVAIERAWFLALVVKDLATIFYF